MTLADVALAAPRDLEIGLTREWLVTNGLGGYASGTVVGVNTRRYHGLLIAAVRPPVQRTALLIRLDDVLTVNDRPVDLMAAEYEDGTIFPHGYTHLAEFDLEDGVPTWLYAVDGALLRRSIWMVPGRNITAIRYKLVAGTAPVELALRPLTAARDHHAVQHGNPGWRFAADAVPDGVRVRATPDSAALWLLVRGADYIPAGDWYWKYLLRQERDRGYDHIEDLYQPGTFRASLEPGQSLTLIASADDPAAGLPDLDVALSQVRGSFDHAAATAAGRSYAAATVDALAAVRELATALAGAAEAFVVRRAAAGPDRAAQTSIIAGYHWFADWGRDAMICLPGLLLLTGRAEQATSLLRTFAASIDQGMIPNRFPDTGEAAEYNTADATLWFFQALRATLVATSADGLLAELWPRLRGIVEWHLRGTRYGIGVDLEDGLLRAGQPAGPDGTPATQLTWMDAREGDTVFTPRIGKPVEINALWIGALSLMAGWAGELHEDPEPYRQAAARARASFGRRFWYAEGGYLYDVVDGPDGDDPALRPNQLIALALDEDLLPAEQARSALAAATEHLLTPYGLPHPLAQRSAVQGPVRGRPAHARSRLSPGDGLALAARPLCRRPSSPAQGPRRPGGLAVALPRSPAAGRAWQHQRDLRWRCAAHAAGLHRPGVERGGVAAHRAWSGAVGSVSAPALSSARPRRPVTSDAWW